MHDEERDDPLGADGSAEERDATLPARFPSGLCASSDAERVPPVPEWIAGYRILRKLGEGGMGIVYEAEQQDPRRPVALKILRGGRLASDRQVEMFRREERTLARLKHPGIAAIYEAGLTEEGQHFYAMELVRGVPLDAHLRKRPLDTPPTQEQLATHLELFLQICDAVNYAHQKGVLHRDLKPSNILVTREAAPGGSRHGTEDVQVKVLDFGLARILDTDPDVSTVFTEHGLVQGTLGYMSPEQARGDVDHVDVRSDVYALGVILYELLVGRTPYEVRQRPLHEAVRAICLELPPRPGTIVHRLRGDLDAILLKALEKDPARRYQNVLMLADDLRRYLENRPIQARSPSLAYQFLKLVSRHRTAFAFTAALFLLLVGFAATMSVMYGIQRRARLKAASEAHKAEEINRFLQGMLASAGPDQALGREVTVREVLDAAAARIPAGLADQPDIQAAVHNTIGVTYRALGVYDASEFHLEAALSAHQSLHGDRSPTFAASMDELAQLRHQMGDFAAAESLARRAVAIDREQAEGDGLELATSLNTLGVILQAAGRHEEADSCLRQALAIRQRLLGHEHEDVAVSLSNLASLLQATGDLAGAELFCRQALDMRLRLMGRRHPDTAASLNNMAVLLLREGKLAEAERYMREGLEAARLVFGLEHPNVVRCLNNLADILQTQGKLDQAELLHREALATGLGLFGEGHPAVAASLNNLASLLMAQEKYAEADSLYRETLAMRRTIYGQEHPAVATGLQNIAILRQRMGLHREAESLYRQALEIRRRTLGDDHPDVASSLLGLGSVLGDQNRAREGEPLLRRSLAIRKSMTPANPRLVAAAAGLLGHCLTELGRYPEAESLLSQSCSQVLSSAGATTRQRREALQRLTDLYDAWGKPDSAAKYEREMQRLTDQEPSDILP